MTLETVTVLFTDLVGSTELLTRVGEDRAETLRREHFALLREALGRHGGREVKNVGDGLMMAFHSVIAALGCAVAIQQELHARNGREKEPMSIRIGISSGEADAADGDYFGVSVVEAARLCASADGDQILTSEITRLLASSRGGFELRSVGARELRGLDAPVEAYEVRWTPKPPSDVAVPLPPRLQRAEGAVFVGRDAHCSLLDDALKHADVAAEQRVVLLSGEPGIGKTALVSRFAVEAHACGAAVLYGRCDEDLLVPYQPWVEALTHLVDHAPEHVLAEHVGERGADLVALVPALAARISDLPASRGTDTDTERHLLFGAVIDLLARSSTERAVALLLDDLQWADRATLQLLRNVASAAVPCRLVVVGTFRDANLGAHHPLTELLAALHRESGVERMVLGGLDDVELQALMEAAAGHALAQDGIMLRDALLAETDGNPFFVVEILRHLAETGAIEQGASGRWVTSEDLHATGLPVSVREVVGHRVERLGADAARVLSAAAVVGCDFDLALLLRIVDLDEDHLLDVLDDALRVSLVREEPGSPERYSFVHALIQRTIYDELSGARRRRLHGRIASALEELPGARIERIAELAHHWLATSLPENALRAYECAMAAGEGAILRLAPDEAVRWFSRALELVAQLDDPTTARCGTLIKLGLAQRLAGVPEFREILIEAGRLAQSSGDADRLVAAALANSRGFQSNSGRTDDERVAMLRAALDAIGDSSPVQRARLLGLLGTESSYASDVDVDALFDEALALTSGIDDAAARLQVMNAVQLSYMTPHNLERRRALLAEQAALIVRADPAQRAWYECARESIGSQFDNAAAIRAQHERFRKAADRIGDPTITWTCALRGAMVATLWDDLDEAEHAVEDALQLGTDTGQPDAFAVYAGQLVVLRRMQGRSVEICDLAGEVAAANSGLPAFRGAHASLLADAGRVDEATVILDDLCTSGLDRIDVDQLWGALMSWLAQAAGIADHRPTAEQVARLIAPFHAQRPYTGVALSGSFALALGICNRVLEDYDEADVTFREADAMSEQLAAPYWIALTKLEWGAMLQARDGDTDDAIGLLTTAAAIADRRGYRSLKTRADAARPS